MRVYSIFVSVSRCQPTSNKLSASFTGWEVASERRQVGVGCKYQDQPARIHVCVCCRGSVLQTVRHFGMRCEKWRWLGVPSGFSLAAGDEGGFCEVSHMADTRRGYAGEDFCSPANGLSFCFLPTRMCSSELKPAEGADSAHSTNVVQGPRRRL